MGLAFDGAGNLFVADIVCGSDTGWGSIFKFAPDGTKSTFAADTYNIAGLAFDLSGNLFGTIGGVAFSGGVVEFASEGQGTVISLSGGPGIAFNSAGSFFVSSVPNGAILKFTGSEMTLFASGLDNPYGLAVDATGDLFEADFGSGKVIKLAADGAKTTFASGLTQPTFLAFEPVVERLRNISARALVGKGDDVLIGGFIVGGNALANNAVVARAIGPSLAQAGLSNPLADPMLELHDASGALVAANDDWQDSQEDQITDSGLAPTDPYESAIYATLPAGSYTAIVRGAGDSTGTALVEVYSLSQ